MNTAQSDARQSLLRFLSHVVDQRGVAAEGAMVKVAFPAEKNGEKGVEVIWVGPFGLNDGAFLGLLANQPQNMAEDAGDAVAFSEDMIRDWAFPSADGRLFGAYTTRAMLHDMNPEASAKIEDVLTETVLPAGW